MASGKKKCMKEIVSNHLHIRLTKIKNIEDGFMVTIQCMLKNSNVFLFKVRLKFRIPRTGHSRSVSVGPVT